MNIKNWFRNFKFWLLLAFLLRLILIIVGSYHPDILNHVDWGNKFWQYGVKDFYEKTIWGVSWPNQPLGSIYLFAIIAKLTRWFFAAAWWLNLKLPLFPSFIFPFLEAKLQIILLKTPFILADLGLGWLIYQIGQQLTRKKKLALLGMILFLFNPPLVYNSAVWGQTDSLVNFLALWGLWQFYRRHYYQGWLGFLLSWYFKMSLVVWAPALFILGWLYRRDWPKIFLAGFLMGSSLIIISLPAVHHGNVLSWLWYLYTNRIFPRQGHMLSGNAFNFWTLLYGIDLSLRESIRLYGVSAKMIGRTISLTITIAVSGLSWWQARQKGNRFKFQNALWLVLLISFAVFLFLTNMHERYLYPIFAPLAILTAVGEISMGWYILLSLIHWLNLYNLWWYPHWQWLENILEWRHFFLPRALSLVLVLIFVRFCLFAYNKGDEKV